MLAVAMAYVKRGRRMRCGEKNTWHIVAARRMGGFAYPPTRDISEISPGFTGVLAKALLPFLRVFLNDMRISEVQVNGRGAEPVMTEDFLDSGQ